MALTVYSAHTSLQLPYRNSILADGTTMTKVSTPYCSLFSLNFDKDVVFVNLFKYNAACFVKIIKYTCSHYPLLRRLRYTTVYYSGLILWEAYCNGLAVGSDVKP